MSQKNRIEVNTVEVDAVSVVIEAEGAPSRMPD